MRSELGNAHAAGRIAWTARRRCIEFLFHRGCGMAIRVDASAAIQRTGRHAVRADGQRLFLADDRGEIIERARDLRGSPAGPPLKPDAPAQPEMDPVIRAASDAHVVRSLIGSLPHEASRARYRALSAFISSRCA